MNNASKQEFVQEDEIDLRELWATLMQRKRLIIVITTMITVFAIAYTLLATPIYRVKAVLEMGQIAGKSILNRNDVIQKLKYLYEVDVKDKKVEYPVIESISIPKRTENIILVNALGYSNKSAMDKLNALISTSNTMQQDEINTYILFKKQQIALIDQDIFNNEKMLDELNEKMDSYEKKVLNIERENAALAGIFTIEIGKIQTSISTLRQDISRMKNERSNLELDISPRNIKQAKLIGELEVLEKPVKPKKILIIVVAFITGFMLSVFLAFFLEFIKGGRKEETQEA